MQKKQEIIVTDLEPKVFKAMLHFIHMDTLTEEVDMVPLTTSSDFAVSETLTAKLLATADNQHLNSLADDFHAMELKVVCLKFAAQNLAAFVRSEGFVKMIPTKPMVVETFSEYPLLGDLCEGHASNCCCGSHQECGKEGPYWSQGPVPVVLLLAIGVIDSWHGTLATATIIGFMGPISAIGAILAGIDYNGLDHEAQIAQLKLCPPFPALKLCIITRGPGCAGLVHLLQETTRYPTD
ncbi:BTB/POZ and MATH domain-containing protein 5 [Sesbania bispinosa]|nr:BTB/POZ and MATH domain-containing protein 5 [Sesbania bispinosa]